LQTTAVGQNQTRETENTFEIVSQEQDGCPGSGGHSMGTSPSVSAGGIPRAQNIYTTQLAEVVSHLEEHLLFES